MKPSVIFSILAGIMLLVWGLYAWQNSEFVFENENTPKDLVPHPLPTSPSKEVEGLVGRENIFEYGEEDAVGEAERKTQKPEVTYTASGFAPAVLHVDGSASVVFLNKSGKKMKLVSDFPEFPNPKEIADGASFNFIFKNKGSWSIGDSLNASLVGVVSVE
ncbi:hypothetical protein L0Y69_00115 [bacterium]|nr:hypothetical protein [bacterium]